MDGAMELKRQEASSLTSVRLCTIPTECCAVSLGFDLDADLRKRRLGYMTSIGAAHALTSDAGLCVW